METYKNSYKKNEDAMLWELHQIRYNLRKETEHKNIEQINREALEKYQDWQKHKAISPKKRNAL